MKIRYFAGVGSRVAPPHILKLMRKLAARLAAIGYVLRSGAAIGSDTAFEEGYDSVGGEKEIWLPWPGYENHVDTGLYPTAAHHSVAATLHPIWHRLGEGPQKLHARNVGQILGKDLLTPVEFVLCWTKDGAESDETRNRDTGGTGTAIGLASRHGIPVFNLANEDAYDRFIKFILAAERTFHEDGSLPDESPILVFGSNLAGRHGKGSALVARESFGARYGQGQGPAGRSYAIPTKDGRPGTPKLKDPAATLPLPAIRESIDQFIGYAKAHPNKQFFIVRLGCDLATHKNADVAPLFALAPSNCSFPETWRPWLGPKVPAVLTPGASVSFPKTRVVHVEEDAYDIYIGDQQGDKYPKSIWANTYQIGPDGSEKDVLDAYTLSVRTNPLLMSKLGELKGKTLGCLCKSKYKPQALCHGDVLAALADGRPWTKLESQQGSLF